MEESAPLDTEAKKEAEVIRQVRESDPTSETKTPSFPLEQLEELTSTTSVSETPTRSVPETAFSNQASLNSGGAKFWETFDGRYRTPPPPPRLQRQLKIFSVFSHHQNCQKNARHLADHLPSPLSFIGRFPSPVRE